MKGIISDHNIEGHVRRLERLILASKLGGLWRDVMKVGVFTFTDFAWPGSLPDREVWKRCQAEELILVTDNRNQEDDSSLEAAIRDETGQDSFPVFTIGSMDRFRNERGYAERIALEVVEMVFDLLVEGKWLGAGRVFIPQGKSNL